MHFKFHPNFPGANELNFKGANAVWLKTSYKRSDTIHAVVRNIPEMNPSVSYWSLYSFRDDLLHNLMIISEIIPQSVRTAVSSSTGLLSIDVKLSCPWLAWIRKGVRPDYDFYISEALTHWGLNILQLIFLNVISWIKIFKVWLEFQFKVCSQGSNFSPHWFR